MSTIAFFSHRENHLKILLPIIAEQKKNFGCFTSVLILPAPQSTLFPNKNDSLLTKQHAIQYDVLSERDIQEVSSVADIIAVFRAHAVTFVVMVGPIMLGPYKELRSQTAQEDIQWCALPANGDELQLLSTYCAFPFSEWDIICSFNAFGKDLFCEFMTERGFDARKFENRIIPLGSPEFAQLMQLDFDRESILRAYGLPHDKHIIFLAAATLDSPIFTRFERLIFFNPMLGFIARLPGIRTIIRWQRKRKKLAKVSSNYEQIAHYAMIMSTIRSFADRNNAIIVSKRRKKDGPIKKRECTIG